MADGSRACSRCPHLHMSGAEARPRHAWGQLCHPHFADRGTLPTAQGLTSWTGQAGGQLVGPRHSVVTTVIRGPEGTPCWSEPRHCCLRLRQQLGSGLRYPAGSAPWGFVIVAESLPPACSLRQSFGLVFLEESRRVSSSSTLWSQPVSISIGHSGAQTTQLPTGRLLFFVRSEN